MNQKKGQNAIIARPSSSPYSVVDVNKLEDKAFQNVKDQIGFCGIWCGSCVAGNGAVVELTRRFEEVVRKYNLEKWARALDWLGADRSCPFGPELPST